MIEIKQQFVPESKRKATYGTGNPKKKLVVHQTGNPRKGADAQMHANLQSGGYSSSWHVQSDDKVIIQSWPFTYRLWHASTGRAANGGNMVGIGWEICINEGIDYLKSLEIAAEGIAQVMKQEGIPMSGLTTHKAEDPNNKNCPAQILSGKDGIDWPSFKQMVQEQYDGKTTKPVTPSTPKPAPAKSIETLAQEVIAGKHGVGDARKNALGSQYDAVQKRVNEILGAKSTPTPKPKLKSVDELAREVIDGKHGTGEARKKSLGNRYTEVQNRVNQILGAKPVANKKSIDQLAREVIDGKWGNDPDRSRKLKNAGYDANAVQKRVNQLLK